jgi:peptidoglycan/xylan/chitin deacetylase (PgdA/CDA1 family)
VILRFLLPKKLIPLYHIVSPEAPPHIRHLYPVPTPKQFERDLDDMLRLYEPVDAEEIINPSSYSKRQILLSFDDGLKECAEFIGPILNRKGVPGIFFVNSAFVDNQGLFFRYKVSLILEVLRQGKSNSTAGKDLLRLQYQDEGQIDQIAHQLGLDFNAYLQETKPYMSLEDLKKLSAQGHHVGAHTHTHPLLMYLSERQRDHEIGQSVEWITQHFPEQKRYFAFPFTDYGISNTYLRHIQSKFSLHATFGCAGIRGEHSKSHLQRLPMEPKGISALSTLRGACVKGFLLRISGRYYINRSQWK